MKAILFTASWNPARIKHFSVALMYTGENKNAPSHYGRVRCKKTTKINQLIFIFPCETSNPRLYRNIMKIKIPP